MKPIHLSILPALLIALGGPAHAGSLRVAPLKIFFDGTTASATLQVRNSGPEKTTIQASVRDWSLGDDGRDAYADTDEFVFFPRIFEVEAGAEGVVRLAYRGPAGPASERAYRIFLRELPTPGKREEGVGFLIELSVPIFVRAVQPRSEGAVSAGALVGGRAQVLVENRGTEFFVVDTVTATGRDAEGQETFRTEAGGWYVLAGTARPFSVEVDPAGCRRSAAILVEASWNGAARGVEFPVRAEDCPEERLPPPGQPGGQ